LTLAATPRDTPGAQEPDHAISSGLGSAARGGAEAAAALLAGLADQESAADGESQSAASESNASIAARASELASQATRAAASEQTVATHVRDPRWAEEFGARVSLLVRARESHAAIQLTPVDLGPVDVNVTVRDSQATIQFGAANAD